ncbi:MAG TPA: hypothetical protein QGH10_12260, partial [Armatimonadota bacterium]|nr:hypothetical protein [Armatimonadota bacterium]
VDRPGARVGPIELGPARIGEALSHVADEFGLMVLAEVYPGTEWDEPRALSVPAGPPTAVFAAIAEAYGYEWGQVEGVYVLRKGRPWEQPRIAPELSGGPFMARRDVWDGEGFRDTVAAVWCDAARVEGIL